MIKPDCKVLVVDQMATSRHAICQRLREMGFIEIDQVHNDSQALELIQGGRYGLVLSEWELSALTGLELLKAVRADPQTRNLPFVLMTDQVQVDKVIAARQAGVSGYLVKPFSIQVLKQKLTGVFDGRMP